MSSAISNDEAKNNAENTGIRQLPTAQKPPTEEDRLEEAKKLVDDDAKKRQLLCSEMVRKALEITNCAYRVIIIVKNGQQETFDLQFVANK